MTYKITYKITQIIELYEVNELFIHHCIEQEWIIPADIQKKNFDMEDITRILLIKDLKDDFGVNNESVPIILHLIDQLHWSQSQVKHYYKIHGN
jgi:hypothetical protein